MRLSHLLTIKCQVCRYFRQIFDDSPQLQYLFQLGLLGYAEPRVPRVDLTYTQKVRLLREHSTRIKNLEGHANCVRFYFNGRPPSKCSISQGILAHLSPSNAHGFGYIHVYRLPSFNRNLNDFETWSHENLGIGITDFGISSALDLLILFELHESLTGFHGPAEPTEAVKIHLRSLKSGSNHPAAIMPVIMYAPRRRIELDFDHQIVGDYLVVHFRFVGDDDDTCLAVWNWTTGGEIMVSILRGFHKAVFHYLYQFSNGKFKQYGFLSFRSRHLL